MRQIQTEALLFAFKDELGIYQVCAVFHISIPTATYCYWFKQNREA